jgi:hypothetical protein
MADRRREACSMTDLAVTRGISALRPLAARNCNGCTMCCKVFEIPELNKPDGTWCGHCDAGKGCTIYDLRPQPCRDFFCTYRIDADVPEHWRPDKSHLVLKSDATGTRIIVGVDPQRPQAWREKPYYQDLKRWSANRLQAGKQVHVRHGRRTIVILPDRDVDLGVIRDDQVILSRQARTPAGAPSLELEVIAKDDPRARAGANAAAMPTALRRR